MSAIPYDSQTQDWETPEQEQSTKPGRPRRRWFNRKSAALAAVVTCAAGFYAGIRVEKSQLASTATAATPAAGNRQRPPRAPPGSRVRGLDSRAAAAAPAARNASFGTVSSVSGNTIYLTDTSGNTVKVTLSSATKVTKKPDRLQGIGTARRQGRDPGRQGLQRHDHRHLGERLRR